MNQFVSIGEGIPYREDLPEEVSFLVSQPIGEHFVSRLIISKVGDPDWEANLKTFMFLHGWCYPEDNAREIRNDQ